MRSRYQGSNDFFERLLGIALLPMLLVAALVAAPLSIPITAFYRRRARKRDAELLARLEAESRTVAFSDSCREGGEFFVEMDGKGFRRMWWMSQDSTHKSLAALAEPTAEMCLVTDGDLSAYLESVDWSSARVSERLWKLNVPLRAAE